MRWEDEQFVKIYTRDTGDWISLGWEAQSLLLLMLRKVDRAGLLHVGKSRLRGLAGMTGMPVDVVGRALPLLLEDGCVSECDAGYLIPNFVVAQEARQTDRARKATQRQKDRDIAAAQGIKQASVADILSEIDRSESHGVTLAVTSSHTASHGVTLRREETRLEETREDLPASQEPESVPERPAKGVSDVYTPEREELHLTSPTSKRTRKQRKPTAAEELFRNLQAMREERCGEVGEPVVAERWDFEKQNTRLRPEVEAPPEAQALFEAAWGLYLADDAQRARLPAWSLSWFMSSGVRAKYETLAAREGEAA